MWRIVIFLFVKFSLGASNKDDSLKCINFDIKHIIDFTSSINLTNDYPNFAHESSNGVEPDLPLFGSLATDWSRLIQLHNKLPENSRLQGNLIKLYRLLAVAYLEAQHSMVKLNNFTSNIGNNIIMKKNNAYNTNQNSKSLNRKSVKETNDNKNNLATQPSDNFHDNKIIQVSDCHSISEEPLRLNLSLEIDKGKINNVVFNLTDKKQFDNKNKLTNNSVIYQEPNNKIELDKILEYLKKEVLKNLTTTLNLNEKNNQYSYQGNQVYESKKNKKSTDSVLLNESTTINNFSSRYEQTTSSAYQEKNLPIINNEEKLKTNNKTDLNIHRKIYTAKAKILNEKNDKMSRKHKEIIDHQSSVSTLNKINDKEINILQRLVKNDLNNHYYYDYYKKINSTL
ncbi:hypothetical protein HCN44_001686 [Aphidius gifuensis]|uniref:Venom protein n=1 Tax=Aphidius gifuensis TaxID=684658 RepID=A0A834XUC2_APHGI|nr:hypothetical protein HCN44_001686 [Aphidius gifuensis]